MSSQPNSREVAAISIVEMLTKKLRTGAVGERIRALRRGGATLRSIAAIVADEFETFRDEEVTVLTSAVSAAARRLVGKRTADAVAEGNHHELTTEHRSNGGKNSGIEQRSEDGILARGEHAWSMSDDRALLEAMEQADPFHTEHGCGFWFDVSKILEGSIGRNMTPKSCSSRAYKISLKKSA